MKLTVLPYVARTAIPVANPACDRNGGDLPDAAAPEAASVDSDELEGPSPESPELRHSDIEDAESEHAGLARGLAIETARILTDWPGIRVTGPFNTISRQSPLGGSKIGRSPFEQSTPGYATPDASFSGVGMTEEFRDTSGHNDDPLGLSHENPFYIADPALVSEQEAYLQGRLMAEPGGWRLTLRLADPFDDHEIAGADCSSGRDNLAELLLRSLNELAAKILPATSNVIPRLATLDSDALSAYCCALDAVVQLEEKHDPAVRRAHLENAIQQLEYALEADTGMKYAKLLLEAICQLYWHLDILPQKQLAGLLGALVHQGEATPALMRYFGVLTLENGDPAGAAGHLRRALRAGDNRELCAFYLARAAEMRQDWIAASGWAKVLLKIEPNNPAYLALAGKACHKLDKLDEAQRFWTRALEEDDELWQVRCGLAVIDLEADAALEALDTLQPALGLDPPPWPVMKLATIAAHQGGQTPQAVEYLEDAAARCQFHGEEMLEAARLAIEVGDNKLALHFAEDVFHLYPDSEHGDAAARLIAVLNETDFEERLKLAAAAIASNRSREILESLEDLAIAHPFVWQTKFLLASARWESGDLDGAEMTLHEALHHRPSSPDLHYRLSSLLLERRRLTEAEASARRGIACGEERAAQGFGHLAMALGYQQRWKEAREAARDAGTDARASAIRVLVEWMRQQHLKGEEAPLPKHGRISMAKVGGAKLEGAKRKDETKFVSSDDEPAEKAPKGRWAKALAVLKTELDRRLGWLLRKND